MSSVEVHHLCALMFDVMVDEECWWDWQGAGGKAGDWEASGRGCKESYKVRPTQSQNPTWEVSWMEQNSKSTDQGVKTAGFTACLCCKPAMWLWTIAKSIYQNGLSQLRILFLLKSALRGCHFVLNQSQQKRFIENDWIISFHGTPVRQGLLENEPKQNLLFSSTSCSSFSSSITKGLV